MEKIVKICDLKKGDIFIFNDLEYHVKRKFRLWSKNDDKFLESFSTKFLNTERFYYGDLQVKKIIKDKNERNIKT